MDLPHGLRRDLEEGSAAEGVVVGVQGEDDRVDPFDVSGAEAAGGGDRVEAEGGGEADRDELPSSHRVLILHARRPPWRGRGRDA